MTPYFFSSVSFRDLEFDTALWSALDWLLGIKAFSNLRRRRLAAGVPAEWTEQTLFDGRDLRGERDALARTRSDGDRFLLNFTHRNERGTPPGHWHTNLVLTRHDRGCRLSIGVRTTGEAGVVPLDLTDRTPALLRHFASSGAAHLEPFEARDAISPTAIHVERPDDVARFGPHLLLRSDRAWPVVVVTCPMSGEPALVNPELLASALAWMAPVLNFDSPDVARAWTSFLTRRKFPQQFGVFDGGVKLYEPEVRPDQDYRQHFLWLPQFLRAIPAEDRTGRLLEAIRERVLARSIPPQFFDEIDELDRAEAVRTAGELKATAEALTQLKRLAQQAQAALESERKDRSKEKEAHARDHQEWQQEQAELKNTLLDQQSATKRLSLELDEMKQKRETSRFDSGSLSAIVRLLRRAGQLDDVVALCKFLFAGKLRFHADACRGLDKWDNRISPEALFKLLSGLAIEYLDALGKGRAPVQAGKAAFGAAYKEREARSGKDNDRAISERTFIFGTESVFMESHLAEGDAFRIYFDCVNGIVRIGHIGNHLYLKDRK